MKSLVTNAELAGLEAALVDAQDFDRLAPLVALAWHLRQRETARAVTLAGEARTLCENAQLSNPDRKVLAGRLLLIEGEAKWLFAQFDNAQKMARAALALFEEVDDATGCADAHWLLASLMIDLGQLEQRDAELQYSGEQARRAGDVLRSGLADAAIARWAVFKNVPAARERWGTHFTEDTSQHHPGLLAWIYDFWGNLAFQTGDFAKSLTYRLPMYALLNDTGQIHRAIFGASNIGGAFTNLNDTQTALEWMERGLVVARASGWPVCIGSSMGQAADVLRQVGRLDNAHQMLLEAIEYGSVNMGSRSYAITLEALGFVLLDQCMFDDALRTFTQLEKTAAALNHLDLRRTALRGGAAASLGLGRHAEALAGALHALELSESQGDTYNQIETLSVLAQILTKQASGGGVQGSTKGHNALDYLQKAMAVAATVDGYIVPGGLLDSVAREYALIGDWERAYEMSLQAIDARAKTAGKETVNRAIAMQIRAETERARSEGEHHHELAASEARRSQTLQHTNDTLERLGVIGQEITAHLDSDAIFHTLNRHVNGLLDATHFSIYLWGSDGVGLDCAFGMEDGKPMPPVHVPADNATSRIARCVRERREIVHGRDQPVADDPNLIPGTLPTLSALFAPIMVGDRVLGAMTIQSPHARAYAERERLVFRTLCAYGAIGLENASAYSQLNTMVGALGDAQQQLLDKNALLEEAYREHERASLADPLTGLNNRRYLLKHAEADVAMTLRRYRKHLKSGATSAPSNTDLVFFMVDIDHFKAINDQWGHAAGDMVLVQMCDRLKTVARESDYIIRWGGEEFLIVARDTNRLEAPLVAERLRQAVNQQAFDVGLAQPIHKTCSVGFACFPFLPQHPGKLAWSQVLELADQALYMAKRGGRDAWVGFYGTETSNPEHLFQRISLHADAVDAIGELRIVQSDTEVKQSAPDCS